MPSPTDCKSCGKHLPPRTSGTTLAVRTASARITPAKTRPFFYKECTRFIQTAGGMGWLAPLSLSFAAISAEISVKSRTIDGKNYLEVSGIQCDSSGDLDAQINLGMQRAAIPFPFSLLTVCRTALIQALSLSRAYPNWRTRKMRLTLTAPRLLTLL